MLFGSFWNHLQQNETFGERPSCFSRQEYAKFRRAKSLSTNMAFSQRWVYAIWESPPEATSPLNSLFNLTWTYRTDSDFWSPYGTYEQLSPEDIKMKEIATTKDYTVGKTELVAWMVSNCGPLTSYIFRPWVEKYIKVDVFGGCASVFGESRSCPRAETGNCLKKYKFYLSFENAMCEDYITKKYWRCLGKCLFLLIITIIISPNLIGALTPLFFTDHCVGL